jgi:thioester reductase-like protein
MLGLSRTATRALRRGSDRSGDCAVLLTGATGFIGMEILARYLERSDRPIYALVRARDDAEAGARLRGAIKCLFGDEDAYPSRLTALAADIEQPGLGLDARRRDSLAERVTDVVHSAASVSFSLPIAESRLINVEGTRHMLELAEVCRRRGHLERFTYISTAYVAGTHRGEFREDELDLGQRFRNPYELSKWEAEKLVRAHGDRLPIQVIRPSIVVGEQTTGWTASFNVLYSPIKAFARGMLPALPARRSSPVDVVPVDYVADAVFELSHGTVEGTQTYHLVAGPGATSVGRLIELSASHVGRREPVVIPPRLYRKVVYPLLVRRSDRRLRQGLERSRVFFPYFSMDVSYADDNARARLEPAGIRVPPIESYFGRLIDYAAKARWGRTPVSRAEAMGLVEPPEGSEPDPDRAPVFGSTT